jgi:hypothetical protein
VATANLTKVLDEAGVHYELLSHAHTETATAEAKALGLAAGDVAKTLVLRTPDGYLRAMLPASERLDLRKLRELLGAGKHKVHLATEDDLRRTSASSSSGRYRRSGAAGAIPSSSTAGSRDVSRSCSRRVRTKNRFALPPTISWASGAPSLPTSARTRAAAPSRRTPRF